MSNLLSDSLRQLNASGDNGFEGLIARLLEDLTGRRFYLAQSGSQEGRDMSSRDYGSNVLAVECKRYKKNTTLDHRELSGELSQVRRSIPDLDIWLLVATRDVNSTLIDNLTQEAINLGIHFELITEEIEKPDQLEVLCANSINTVNNFFKDILTDSQLQNLKRFLKNIINHPQFQQKKEALKFRLCSELIGYDNWRAKRNQQLLEYLKSEKQSRSAFGQPINIFSKNLRFITRKELLEQLDIWYSRWSNNKKIFTLLGEEGDGKTWGIAHWLGLKLQQDNEFPAVIFLTSNKISSNKPLNLFSEIITSDLNLQKENCIKRIQRWVNNSNNTPKLLLVLDGVNQHYDHLWWKNLLDELCGDQQFQNVRIIITCRTEYWRRKFDHISYVPTHKYTIQSYNNDELTEALKSHGFSRSEFSSEELLKLLRKPRYFNLMLKHYKSIEISGDLTVERLIYEDWKDRLETKNIYLDDEQFRGLIRDLAERVRETNKQYLKDKEIEDNLSFVSNRNEVFQELTTGGILRNKDSKSKINPEFLHYGFGLLLVNQLQEGIEESDKDPEEIIAEWIEPQAEMDIKAKICHYASLIALTDPKLPPIAKASLLKAWINNLNPGLDAAKEFIAYLPCDSRAYIELAEIIGSDTFGNPWAEELIKRAFMKWKKYPNILDKLSLALEKWLGFLRCDGFSNQRHPSVRIEEIRREINERVGQELKPGFFKFHGYELTVIEDVIIEDDGLLRLGRFALGLIIYLPIQNFVKTIVTGIIAEEIMGFPGKNDLFNWAFRSAAQSIWNEIKLEVEHLLTSQSLVAKKAAYRLLLYEGSKEAYEILQTLDKEILAFNQHTYEYDPCNFQWTQDNYENCLSRTDLRPELIASRIKSICINPELVVPDDLGQRLEVLVEQISINSISSTYLSDLDDHKFEEFEPALCAYAPKAIANLVRQITRNITQRTGISLRQLSFNIVKNYLILGSEEKECIYQAWQNFEQNCNTSSELDHVAEAYLFQIVLKELDAEQQLNHILQRLDPNYDFISFEKSFKPITNIEIAFLKVNNQKSLQRILWFIANNREILQPEVINQYIYPHLENDDSLIRSSVLEIIYKFGDNEIIQKFLNCSWQWNSQHHRRENHWGSLILGKYGENLSYSSLNNRIHPAYQGYAIRCRGMQVEEVRQYADDIHKIWIRLTTEVPRLPDDFPIIELNITSDDNFEQFYNKISLSDDNFVDSVTFSSRNIVWGIADINSSKDQLTQIQDINANSRLREEFRRILTEVQKDQLEFGNYFFCEIPPKDVIAEISQYPKLVDIWLTPIKPEYDNKTAEKIIQIGSTFYSILCSVLLDVNHPHAINLYHYLKNINRKISLKNSPTNICFLDYALFQVIPNGSIENEWQSRFESCNSDLELMEMTIAAQQGHALNWLNSYINTKLNSSAPLDFSRAVTILGFLETDDAFTRLSQLKEEQPNTWKKEIINISLNRWQSNSWAKQWFYLFMNTDDRLMAWSYFRLFLRCVDKRFWLWKDKLICNSSSNNFHQLYLIFFEENINKIENFIRKYERDLEKYFLCYRLSQELLQISHK
ncbi:NACHT domain-containing protein [Nostoc sp.]